MDQHGSVHFEDSNNVQHDTQQVTRSQPTMLMHNRKPYPEQGGYQPKPSFHRPATPFEADGPHGGANRPYGEGHPLQMFFHHNCVVWS